MESGRSINSLLSGKLDDLTTHQGSSFSKEAAWEKLCDRLRHRKSRKIRAAYIWTISVSVAASIICFFLLPGNNKKDPGKTVPAVVTQMKTTSATLEKATTPPAPVLSVAKNSVTPQPVGTKKTEQDLRSNVEQIGITSTIGNVTTIDTIASSVPISQLVAAVPKKLKVIHNNELGGSAPVTGVDASMVASARPSGFFRLGMPEPNSFEEVNGDTLKKQKFKKSFLSFNSLISQKE